MPKHGVTQARQPRLWVYKCNAKNKPHQRACGDWRDFFRYSGAGEWGGSWVTGNHESRNILLQEMHRGDLILACQTGVGAIGLCRLVRLSKKKNGETALILEPMQQFPRPVNVLALKKHNAVVRSMNAFAKGKAQTFYRTSGKEARELLRVCGVRTRLRLDDERASCPGRNKRVSRRQTPRGVVFLGRPDPKVEHAAVAFVTREYCREGWTVHSVESEHRGYDLVCRKAGRLEQHVEVKGCGGTQLRFAITANELNCAREDKQFRLAVVTKALRRQRTLDIWSGKEALRIFDFRPIEYVAVPRNACESQG